MRTSSIAVAAVLAVTCMATSLQGQKPDSPIDPRSMAFVAQARTARAAGKLEDASDLLETALAIDPRNAAALVLDGDVSRQRGLPGSAVRLYHDALLIDPNDIAALRGQGEAFVAKGAVHRAQDNLARIRTLCKGATCADAGQLAAAIAKGPPVTTAQMVKPSTPATE